LNEIPRLNRGMTVLFRLIWGEASYVGSGELQKDRPLLHSSEGWNLL